MMFCGKGKCGKLTFIVNLAWQGPLPHQHGSAAQDM